GKLLPLFSFAVGVELAQITVVIALLILTFFGLTVFKFSKRDWVLVISAIVLGIAIPILYARKFW
ncbi:MAG: HupE/UreJ family protein, partial [Zetaproteobacteria bacterium]|nr:HupE/UreJ family protein [Flavobacteriales bacterium]